MTMWIINLVGVVFIGLIVWWFWLYKPNEVKANKDLIITVENGVYSPSYITVPPNQAVSLVFNRKDPAPCAEQLLIPEFNISEPLVLNQHTRVHLPAMPTGEYEFHCQMKMYKGTLRVSE